MKKFKIGKVLFSLLFILGVFLVYNSIQANSIKSISMDIYVDEKGDAFVTEIWKCKTNQGTESYHPYFNLGNSVIKDLSVSEAGVDYRSEKYWNTSGTLESKAYKCGINKTYNGVELCWGISKYGNHTYIVKYTITNFVSELSDSQMIYWTLIPQGFSNEIGDVNIKIHTNSYIPDDINVWGYGKYGGTCYVAGGNIEFNSMKTLKKNEYMTILAKFPLGTFKATNKLNHDFSYYLNMAEIGSTKYNDDIGKIDNIDDNDPEDSDNSFDFSNIKPIIFCTILIIAIYIIRYTERNKNSSKIIFGKGEKREVKKAQYFRDIPCGGHVLRAYFIASKYGLIKNKADIVGALLLKWIKEKRVIIEKRKSKSLFKKYEVIFILGSGESLVDLREKELFDMVYNASKDGILEGKEFRRWCSKHYKRIFLWFDNVLKYHRIYLVNEGFIECNDAKLFGIFSYKRYYTTRRLKEEAIKLSGLKKYLKDYTLIHEREPIEVHLFEEYMNRTIKLWFV